MTTRQLVAYGDLAGEPLVAAALALRADPDDAAAAAALAHALFGLAEPVPTAVARRVLGSEGPFPRAARSGLAAGDRRLARAARELDELGALAHGDLGALLEPHGLDDCVPAPGEAADRGLPPAAAALLGELAAGPGWGALTGRLADFHRLEGTGPLAMATVLQWSEGVLAAVPHPDPIRVDDLEGYAAQRAPLLADLEGFTAGQPANDALLYGPPGTGKSASVRACAAAHADGGLRLVQAARGETSSLPAVFAALRGEGPRCVVFLDDLVFDDAGRADRALRAALEGGVAGRPANVLLWATSNRLNLTASSHSERADDVDPAEAAGEKAALADRFGRRVRFERPSRDAYVAIALRLVRDRLGAVAPGTEEAAVRFALAGHGFSPRTARQFAAAYRDGSG